MKQKILIFLLSFAALFASAQTFTAGIVYTTGAPAFNPGAKGSRIAVDTASKLIYTHIAGTTWELYGNTLRTTIGCVPPASAPMNFQSDFVVNGCDSLYLYRAGAWRHMNKGGGAAYTAGAGISISGGSVISNTGVIVEVDGSTTNELQNLSLSGQALSISGGTGATLPVVGITAGASISVTPSAGVYNIVNTAPDQPVTISGATGTYPNFTVTPATGAETIINAGAGIGVTGAGTSGSPYVISNAGIITEVDGSISNERNTSFGVVGANLRITDSGGNFDVPVISIAPDQSATNEIQTLSILSDQLTLSGGGGTVSIPSAGSTATPDTYSEASAQYPMYKWNLRTSNVRTDHWTDGTVAVSFRDTLLALGGWYTTGVAETYDTILYSVNDGATWATYPGNLPANLHTFAFCEKEGYYYIAGGDYLSTATEKKSVWRTNNFRTWQTMTNNAAFGERLLSSLVSYGSNLYLFGGQTGIGSAGLGKNDVWRSADNGANWTKIQDSVSVGGFSFLGQNINNQAKVFQGKFWVVGGQYYGPPFLYTNRVFSIPVDKITDKRYWRRETNIPATGKSYASVEVWDGKIWYIGGYDSLANTREIYYMAKSGIWRQAKNYYGDAPGTDMSITHAASICVHKDRLFRLLGNNSNECYMLSRSNNADTVIANTVFFSRLLNKLGSYSYLSETSGGLASIWGNNVSAGATANTIKRYTSDQSNYMAFRYDRGFWVGTGMASTVLAEVSDTTSSRLRILNNGQVILSDRFSFLSPASERLQVDGNIFARIANLTAVSGTSLPTPLVVTGQTSSGGGVVGRITNTTTNGYTILLFNETNNVTSPFYILRYNSAAGGSSSNLVEMVSSAGNISIRPFGRLGIGTATPHASAKMDVESTTGGLLFPRMTTTQRNAISSPADGLHIYDNTVNRTSVREGSAWVYNLTTANPGYYSGSFSGVGTATTTFTVTIGTTQANNTYKVGLAPTSLLGTTAWYISAKTTTTFDVTYVTGLTGTLTFDWAVFP